MTRQDLRSSAQRILFVYLLPGSDREIILPQGILNEVTTAIEEEGREDPEVFDAAKDYVFQAMERDAFPGFLRSKALGNIVPPSMMMRAIVGLVALFGGLWTAFVLIFLDYNRLTRCWVSPLITSFKWTTPNNRTAHPPVHHRRLRPRLASVHPRPCHGPCRLQRVHLHEVLPRQRALRAEAARQARVERARRGRADRRRAVLPVHLRPGEEAMNVMFSFGFGVTGSRDVPPGAK